MNITVSLQHYAASVTTKIVDIRTVNSELAIIFINIFKGVVLFYDKTFGEHIQLWCIVFTMFGILIFSPQFSQYHINVEAAYNQMHALRFYYYPLQSQPSVWLGSHHFPPFSIISSMPTVFWFLSVLLHWSADATSISLQTHQHLKSIQSITLPL